MSEYNPSDWSPTERQVRIALDPAFEQRWLDEVDHVGDLTDAIGSEMDDGIIDTVTALRLLGFQTVMSCEGHLDHGSAAPWVMLLTPDHQQRRDAYQAAADQEAKRAVLLTCWEAANELDRQLGTLITEFYRHRGWDETFWLTAHPVHDEALPAIVCLTTNERDEATTDEQLERSQDEMNAFTDFLINKLTS